SAERQAQQGRAPRKKSDGRRGSTNRPKNVSDDGLENAPPTRAGNRAQIRPVVDLIPLWSQKLNSWRSAMDSNPQFELPSPAVTICTKTPVPPKTPFEPFDRRGSRNRPFGICTRGKMRA